MARIPDDELERLKREVSLMRLMEAQGLTLTSQGKDLACQCPWHEGDDTPSCIVTPATNLWHCFGCDAGGTVIDWVMRSQRVSFRHACELLMKEHPALAAGSAATAAPKLSSGKLRSVQSFSLPQGDADADAALLNQVIDFYHETLKQSPEALSYLEKRGLGSMELIERFRLGYANRTLAYRLAPKQYKAGAVLRSALQRIGILRESGHEHLNGSIVVPLFTTREGEGAPPQVVGAYGRKLLDNLRPGTPKHLYLPGPHRGVLNGEGLEGAQEIILCEALIDALTFWNAGYRNVTSCYGVNGLTEELLAALKGSGAQRVLIAFDRDEAGDRGAEALAVRLMAEGLECFRLLFPKGMDANAYACAVKPADKSLGVVIRAAQWLGRGVKPAITTHAVHAVREAVECEAVVPASVALAAAASTEEGAAAKEDLSPAPMLAAPQEPVLPEPAAAAMPALPPPEPPAQADEQQLLITYGERCYRVRGWPKQLTEALKVNVLVRRGDDAAEAGTGLHVDTLDLYQAKARAGFARSAASELHVDEAVIQHDLGRLLLKLEQLIEERAKAAETPQVTAPAKMSPEDAQAALAYLSDPQLLTRIVADIERVGLVGEPSNALVAYLACISRKLTSPLAVLIQSTSAAGKSTLMDTILSLIPEEDRVHYSAMTGQSLFYLGEQEIKHRILAIAEEEGVRQAAYALKVLQSQGELTIASTGKDPATGMLVTQQYRVEGPVMLFLTTTAIDVEEELVNRCLVLTINESREQTRAIQARQRSRRTLEGLLAQHDSEAIRSVHHNAQRLLRPLAVVNPYAEHLTFLDDRTRMRRDHAKYLTLIDVIALLRQHQREIKILKRGELVIEYIEVTPADISLANELAHEALGRSLDELPPQTRRVLGMIEDWVQGQVQQRSLSRSDVRLTRRQLRSVCGMSDAAIRVHLERLITMEYVRTVAGRNGQRYEYELLFDGDLERSAPQMIGLIDAAALRTASVDTAVTLQGKTGDLAPTSQGACTGPVPTLQGADLVENGSAASTLSASGAEVPTDGRLRDAATVGRSPSRRSRAGAPAPLFLLSRFLRCCREVAMPAPRSRAKVALSDRHDPPGLAAFVMRYLEWLRVHNYAGPTVESREVYLGYFVAWCTERGITTPREVTKPILERYQRSLYQWRKRDGSPLSFRGQHARLVPVRALFKWLTRQNHLLYNPASELELPRLEHRLPKHVLTIFEVEQVMRTVDLTEPRGIRDRAILEVLYSTGIRRRELIGLALFDFDRERGTVMIRQGKGKKDRMIPVGDRAMGWVDRYQHQVRPDLVVGREIAHLATLFLTHTGEPFTPNRLTQLVRQYVQAADLGKTGSCHLFRHTMATLMLENGADIRYIQAMLGHAELSTTQIYTQVSIRKLKQIHTATHPAKLRTAAVSVSGINTAQNEAAPAAEDVLAALAAEAFEDAEDDEDAGKHPE